MARVVGNAIRGSYDSHGDARPDHPYNHLASESPQKRCRSYGSKRTVPEFLHRRPVPVDHSWRQRVQKHLPASRPEATAAKPHLGGFNLGDIGSYPLELVWRDTIDSFRSCNLDLSAVLSFQYSEPFDDDSDELGRMESLFRKEDRGWSLGDRVGEWESERGGDRKPWQAAVSEYEILQHHLLKKTLFKRPFAQCRRYPTIDRTHQDQPDHL